MALALEKSGGLVVLAVAQDPATVGTLQAVVRDEGGTLHVARAIEEALSLAQSHAPDVAFVDLSVEEGAALALCHHLPALRPTMGVHAVVSARDLERGAEALSLGAVGVLVAPVTGDALGRIFSERRRRATETARLSELERKIAFERRRVDIYDRLVRFARGAAPSEAVRAIVEGVAQLSSAKGVALYATFGDEKSERVRLAAIGTALDLPSTSAPADLARLVQVRSARVVPLVTSGVELGILVLDAVPPGVESDVANVADLAAAMLSIIDRHDRDVLPSRAAPPSSFQGVADRLLALAARHDRRASVLAIAFSETDTRARRDAVAAEISEIVRATDALSGNDDGDLLLFLPETSGLGAHACRRRIVARLSGDRRARPRGSPRGPDSRTSASPVCIGVATFPHYGTTVKRLVRTARTRARDDGRSAVHGLGLEQLALPEIVDTLLSRPMLDAGPRSPFPLDVASTALFSLVVRACTDAKRGGAVSVTTTLQPGLGVAAAARSATNPRVLDVRGQTACEDLEAVVVEAEHGTWVCCGRLRGDRFHGVHAADPLLADVLVRRLTTAGGPSAG